MLSVSLDNKTLTVKGKAFDISMIRKQVDASVKILATGNAVTLIKRRTGLKSYLDTKYHHLLRPSNAVTNELLGSNLEQKITDFSKVQDVAKKLQARKLFSRGKTEFRGQYRNYRGKTRLGDSRKGQFRQNPYQSPRKNGPPRDNRNRGRGNNRRR